MGRALAVALVAVGLLLILTGALMLLVPAPIIVIVDGGIVALLGVFGVEVEGRRR